MIICLLHELLAQVGNALKPLVRDLRSVDHIIDASRLEPGKHIRHIKHVGVGFIRHQLIIANGREVEGPKPLIQLHVSR